MAELKICDACGAVFRDASFKDSALKLYRKGGHTVFVGNSGGHTFATATLDLCPTCAEIFHKVTILVEERCPAVTMLAPKSEKDASRRQKAWAVGLLVGLADYSPSKAVSEGLERLKEIDIEAIDERLREGLKGVGL